MTRARGWRQNKATLQKGIGNEWAVTNNRRHRATGKSPMSMDKCFSRCANFTWLYMWNEETHRDPEHQVLRLCLFLDSKAFRFQAWCLTRVANSDVYRDGGSDLSEGMGWGRLHRDYVYSEHTLHHGGHTKHATSVPPRFTGMSPSP